MLEILQYPFMQRALIAGIVLAAVLALLGVYVLLRRMSFFSDGIAHASLAGIAIGIVFSWQPLATALVLSAIFALIIYFIEKKFDLASDTAIGILFTSGMALGVLLISLQPGYQHWDLLDARHIRTPEIPHSDHHAVIAKISRRDLVH